MNTQNNPFVLPGLGQTGDLAGNPMMASLEMMQQAWANLAGPSGLTQALPMSLEDLDRRLAELRTVENWLKLNQSMLASTIQGMEVQRATIATLKSFVGTAPSGDAPSPLEVVLGIKPAPVAAAAPTDTLADSDTAKTVDVGTAAAAAQSATQAWWNLMQQQFGQLASAAASTMSEAAMPGTAPSATPTAKKTVAKSASKASAKRATPRTRSTSAKTAKFSQPAAKKPV